MRFQLSSDFIFHSSDFQISPVISGFRLDFRISRVISWFCQWFQDFTCDFRISPVISEFHLWFVDFARNFGSCAVADPEIKKGGDTWRSFSKSHQSFIKFIGSGYFLQHRKWYSLGCSYGNRTLPWLPRDISPVCTKLGSCAPPDPPTVGSSTQAS